MFEISAPSIFHQKQTRSPLHAATYFATFRSEPYVCIWRKLSKVEYCRALVTSKCWCNHNISLDDLSSTFSLRGEKYVMTGASFEQEAILVASSDHFRRHIHIHRQVFSPTSKALHLYKHVKNKSQHITSIPRPLF